MKRTSMLVLAGAALVLTVAACGKEGDLDRPGPLWGPQSKADYAAAKRAQADQASNATASGQPGQPPKTGPGSNPYADPGPISQSPIPGEKPNPSGAPQTNPQ
jgi:predicted small lipoprotein YifL